MTKQIKYKSGYKYQLANEYTISTGLWTNVGYRGEYLAFLNNGVLIIHKGYCWDGPSGPVVDRNCLMRGSLVHDALYQLMRKGVISNQTKTREKADRLYQQICTEDGLMPFLAWLHFRALKRFGAKAASSKSIKQVLVSP